MVDQERTQVVIFGAQGRMGRELIALFKEQGDAVSGLELSGRLGRSDALSDPFVIETLKGADVVIDFSLPEATRSLLLTLLRFEHPPALVCGVTGLDEEGLALIGQHAERAPVFYARNFSLGVALLTQLSELSARVLGDAFDVEIFELHHRQKVDAPSGTARHVAEAIAHERGGAITALPTDSPRDPRQIHLSAGRGGQVIGEHTVFFLGEAERLELTHRARERSLFAHGALRAARWLVQSPHQSGVILGMSDMMKALMNTSAPEGGEKRER